MFSFISFRPQNKQSRKSNSDITCPYNITTLHLDGYYAHDFFSSSWCGFLFLTVKSSISVTKDGHSIGGLFSCIFTVNQLALNSVE